MILFCAGMFVGAFLLLLWAVFASAHGPVDLGSSDDAMDPIPTRRA